MEMLTAAREASTANNIDKTEIVNKMAKMFKMDQFMVCQRNMDSYFRKQKRLKDKQDTTFGKLLEYFKSKQIPIKKI